MNLFTEVYTKSADLLKTKCFDERWSNIEPRLKVLLAADGPNVAEAAVLDLVRSTLAEVGKKNRKVAESIAEEMIKLSRPSVAGYQDRAALLKTLKHFYYVTLKGNQCIWVVDHPKEYSKWSYDSLGGKTAVQVQGLLQKDAETFGEENRKLFSQSLQLARKWSMDIVVKLGAPDDKTLAVVKRWFHTAGATDEDVKKSVQTLLDGFKKISAVCNSTRVIFSDRPHKRVDPGYEGTVAAVNPGDAMPIIYIFKLFLQAGKANRAGQISKLWYCALTIIHELSHKVVGTDDIQYDDDGLKPSATLTTEKSLKNADSWGYFATDIVGALPKATFDHVYS